jgi:glyoxylase-like metal-dependent hydrolase (beta-lactamase superfamily II)
VLLGTMRIDQVLDGTATLPAHHVLTRPDVADPWGDHRELLTERGDLELAVGSFVVRTGDRVVLVDTGVGPVDRGPLRGGGLLDGLAALGIAPADVTDVVLTHLHADHTGWATRSGRVVFDHATYRCHEADWAHFVTGADPSSGPARKLLPLADRLDPFGGEADVAPGVTVRSAPGHTPGSSIVVLSSGGERAMLLGDAVHCPVQLTESDWEGMLDVDPALAARTREALVRELESSGVPAAAAHFPGLRFGRLLTGEGRRSWVVSP